MSRLRRTTAALAALAALVVTAGCGGDGGSSRAEPDDVVTLTPTLVPDPEASSAAPPSGPSGRPSGRAPRVVATVASGLAVPWGLDFLPDGDAIVTERDTGRVLRISGPRHVVTEVGRIALAPDTAEGGLLGVAVSPGFADDSLLYFYATTATDNRVVSATLTDQGLGPVRDVLTGIPFGAIHDGGRLAFGPDGDLYVSTGEGGEDERAQDLDSLGGKILRITPTGQAAPGNPDGSPVWSYGHRNVQGLAFTPDGQLWASEFGASTYDELNEIRPGGDYGWPEVEGPGGTERGFVDPVEVWSTDVASPSGLAYAAGSLWLGALRGTRLWQVPVSDSGEVSGPPRDWFVGDYGRMRTVAAAPDGTLWVTTSNRDGRGDPSPTDDRILSVRP